MAKILVADDSITVRKVAERLLTEAGLEVALAASGEEALAWLENERPDFIVTDVIMPDKSGYDVCKYVKSHADLSNTPVLLISGIVNEDVTRKAESCRADGVLKKPFQGASLQDRVLELLGKRNDTPAPSPVQASPDPVDSESISSPTISLQPVSSDSSVVEDSVHEPASAEAASSAPIHPTGPKAFRITEEQLQTFRQSSNRIKELEVRLEEEKARADRMSEEAETAKRRMHEVEATLADLEQRSADRKSQGQAQEELESRNKELSASLAEQQQRMSELTEQLNRFGEMEKRNKELEANIEDLQARLSLAVQSSTTTKGNEDRVPQLQSMITEQQQRLSDLASQVMRFGEAETKIKALEASLANEQSRANDMMQRCAEMEQTAARATMKVEDTTRLLAQIARLASKPEETQDHAST